MNLFECVRIAPRFQRAVRIDSDLGDPKALDGFVCTHTFARALTTLAEQVGRTGQGAFTWTGPYGGGKSSLLIALGALLGSRGRLREQARRQVGREAAEHVTHHLKPGSAGWMVVPVMGARQDPARLVLDALHRSGAIRKQGRIVGKSVEAAVLDALLRISQRSSHSGVLLVFDELGKILEHLASTTGDLHFFQQIAERASRSNGRLVVLGILHQSFDEYTGRLNRGVRDEWAKVQGRYLDIPLSVSGSEQLEIIARAIEHTKRPRVTATQADAVAAALRKYRPDAPLDVSAQLERCWPLHPVTACLLGPISRRRFGQNQRSLFAFLNSHEPGGFQEFLRTSSTDSTYGPDQLFDYLQLNLEPAILASPDGHRWALAIDAVARAEKRHVTKTHLAILKSIALLDLFRERSGLYASMEVLRSIVPTVPSRTLQKSLDEMKSWSVLTYREHLSAFAIYAGSDFDLQAALDDAAEKVGVPELSSLKQLANLRPTVAKRHYHETGALRWFDVDVVRARDLERKLLDFQPNGAMGQFLLVIGSAEESQKSMRNMACDVTARIPVPAAVGVSPTGDRLFAATRELLALDYIRKNCTELSGDAVARREVDARTASAASALEMEVRNAFAAAQWIVGGKVCNVDDLAGLARLASDLADSVYDKSLRIRNELLNRDSPSSNAIAAQKALLKAMVLRPSVARLGIDGFPAEGGLYESVLASTGLHWANDGTTAFRAPVSKDPASLRPLWKATDEFLTKAATIPVSAGEVYAFWRAPPFGVRAGLCPVLFIAYLLSREERYAAYVDNQLAVTLGELAVDRLTQEPGSLVLRVYDSGTREQRLFEGMRAIVCAFEVDGVCAGDMLDQVTLARAIVRIVRVQPNFTLRTTRLSEAALAVRNAIRSADDPHKLLHELLPQAIDRLLGTTRAPIDRCVSVLRLALEEITKAYAENLRCLDQILRQELGINDPSVSSQVVHDRTERVQGLTGDYRLEAFIARLRTYQGALSDIEGIAGLAANKPPRDWSDNDFDRAAIEIADLAQRFNRAEAFARVKGRTDGRHAIAIVVGLDRTPGLAVREFDVTEPERREILRLARDVRAMLDSASVRNEVALAALAQVGSDLVVSRRERPLAANE